MNAAVNILQFGGEALAPTPAAQPPVPAADMTLIEGMRRQLSYSRLDCSQDLDRMCALIAVDPSVSARRYAVALFRLLARTARRPLVFHARGSRRASLDEMWMLRLLRALQAGDEASAKALVGFRVNRDGRRLALFLSRGLAGTIDQLDSW